MFVRGRISWQAFSSAGFESVGLPWQRVTGFPVTVAETACDSSLEIFWASVNYELGDGREEYVELIELYDSACILLQIFAKLKHYGELKV